MPIAKNFKLGKREPYIFVDFYDKEGAAVPIRESAEVQYPVFRIADIYELDDNGQKKIIAIMALRKDYYDYFGLPLLCQIKINEEFVVIVDENALKQMNNRIIQFCIAHELGHINDMKMNPNYSFPTFAQKKKNIEAGIVEPNENSADKYAVQLVGKSEFASVLEYLIRKIKQAKVGKELEEQKALLIKAHELRLKAL